VNARRSACLIVSTAAMLAACSGGSGSTRSRASTTTRPATTTVPPRDANPAYAGRGPHVVAITTLETSTRAIEIFYPARDGSQKNKPRATYDIRQALHDPEGEPLKPATGQLVALPAFRDLPPAAGSFPAVLFSHGFGATPLQNATLESDIAAWGFVVIAPDHVERDTLALVKGRATSDDARDSQVLISSMNVVAADSRLGPILDVGHVAAVGNSEGGRTALAALALPPVDTAVAWASVPPTRPVADKPVMLIGAKDDIEYGSVVQQRIYDALTGPRRLVLLGAGAGHATFADECEDLRESGALTAGGDGSSPSGLLALTQNGCYPDELDPRIAWKAIAHFTVAQLRAVFGIDPAPVGLGDAIAHAFPRVPLTYEHQP
jgi:dienelactone hydrolase